MNYNFIYSYDTYRDKHKDLASLTIWLINWIIFSLVDDSDYMIHYKPFFFYRNTRDSKSNSLKITNEWWRESFGVIGKDPSRLVPEKHELNYRSDICNLITLKSHLSDAISLNSNIEKNSSVNLVCIGFWWEVGRCSFAAGSWGIKVAGLIELESKKKPRGH